MTKEEFEQVQKERKEAAQKKYEKYLELAENVLNKLSPNKQGYWRDKINNTRTEEQFLKLIDNLKSHPSIININEENR